MMVSIIVPIYNSGGRLFTCLDSIKHQTYKDIEVIMVNDGSVDNSAVICKKFASKDSRFIYIEQDNSGVSVARNNGISYSHGEYICFVDSDDSVEPDYVWCMVEAQQKKKADLVVQGLTNISDGKKLDKLEFPEISLNVSSLNDELFEKLFYFCGPYCKLFKRGYIINNHIEFPKHLAYGEDFVFYAKYLHLCKSITFLSEATYNYSCGVNGSLSSKRLHPDKFWEDQLNRHREYEALREQYGITRDFYPSENTSKLIALRGLLSSIEFFNSDIKEYLYRIRSDVDFGFEKIRPRNLSDRLLLLLISRNTIICRILIKKILKYRR